MTETDDAATLPPEQNPFHMVRLAAFGNLTAIRRLASGAADCFGAGDIVGFYEGLTYARMAAARGNDEDVGLLLCLLGMASALLDPADEVGRDGYTGQAIAYSMGAQAKDPSNLALGEMLEQAMDAATPGEMQHAKYYYDLLREADKARVH